MNADIPGAGPVVCDTPVLQSSKSSRSDANAASFRALAGGAISFSHATDFFRRKQILPRHVQDNRRPQGSLMPSH